MMHLSLSLSLTSIKKNSYIMAEKEQQPAYPLASTNGYARSDQEAGPEHAKELRRKKRMKCFIYIVAFVIFQTAIIALFGLTIMKVRGPKFRVRSATIDSFQVGTGTSPSFNLTMKAELGVKNTNFGSYKFDNSTINFFYKGIPVGSTNVLKSRAKLRSTKKFIIEVDLSLTGNSDLGADLTSGVLQLTSQSSLRGKVELFKVMKKKKSTNMNCTMDINTTNTTHQVQIVACK
uniref:Late embryogenesis abundant protein LEA-2 subgroup domain-containing protein n=1 Tax=Davidia involucrata TaxID=16924 RepID=A0A5B7AGB7_DAVIN